MSTEVMWQTRSTNIGETERLGAQVGARLRGGEVIELVSDLGGGKTTFVRGLARGFRSTDKVASPSFTISKVYKSGSKELHHFDFYRLAEAGIVQRELAEIIGDDEMVVVVEWADIVDDVLPVGRLRVHIKTLDENTREFTFEYPKSLNYLLEGLA